MPTGARQIAAWRTYRRNTVAVRTVAVAAAALAAMVGLPVAAAGPPGLSHGTGCDTTRKAVAHHANGVLLNPQPSGAPVPCAVTTGYGGSETRIAVTSDGTLVYEPATVTPGAAGTGFVAGAPGPRPSTQIEPGGLAVSNDDGAQWHFVKPAGLTWVPQDDQLYVDRATGRIFYYALSSNPFPQGGDVAIQDQLPAGYAHLMMSPDDGRSWYHTALTGFVESENPRFASAPPPPARPLPVNYADVVYWCGNNMLFTETYRACYRSLNGGLTWDEASILFSQPAPQHSECGPNAENFNSGDGNYPEPGPDGSLYLLVSCGTHTYLARSTDEGTTWPILKDRAGGPLEVPPADELRVDPRGNLYIVHLAGTNHLLLQESRDDGRTWSAPVDAIAPRVTSINEWFVAERGAGEVAISYLAKTGSHSTYDGYLTVTRDALDQNPVFWSATINEPAAPMMTSDPPQARDDFIGVDIAPDGTPWASFFASCPASATDPACAGQASDPEANRAVAGRLAWVQTAR
jgi:hypothetical protein